MAHSKKLLRVGLIKAIPHKWNLEANWRIFETFAQKAVQNGCQLICTPECFLDGYVAPEMKSFSKDSLYEISQSLDDGFYIKKALSFANEHKVYLVFGFTERVGDGCYNAAALIDDRGTLLGCYRKTHLLDHDRCYLPGEDFPVWETAFGAMGIMICADRRWPETARTLKVRGAEIIMNPTYGMWHLENEWWMRTRSYENELYICFTHPNVSLITDPNGKIAAKLQSNVPDVLIHDIDLSLTVNEMFPYRRTDIYEL
ncbi:MAG: carbon-nitrogen hydrolase family protein [Candidatus Latescibacteria bacterium]|nr:carbon-nitrogen hydrolase family protein [Candidatus Latescibacterota bacterium]